MMPEIISTLLDAQNLFGLLKISDSPNYFRDRFQASIICSSTWRCVESSDKELSTLAVVSRTQVLGNVEVRSLRL